MNFKKAMIILCAAALLAALPGALPVSGEAGIYDRVIRLHVIGSSDGELAQSLKLEARDAVLEVTDALLADCHETDKALSLLESGREALREAAESRLRGLGCFDSVEVTVTEEYYPTREYETMKLPAGTYCSVRVKLGEAAGKNWWCVLFPSLCLKGAAARDELVAAGFTRSQIKILTESDNPKYVLKFRFLELFGQLKNLLG